MNIDKETLEESLNYEYSSNSTATTEKESFLNWEDNKDTETYGVNCDDGNNLLHKLELKESKYNDVQIKVVGYYSKNNHLYEDAKGKAINAIKKIASKIRR